MTGAVLRQIVSLPTVVQRFLALLILATAMAVVVGTGWTAAHGLIDRSQVLRADRATLGRLLTTARQTPKSGTAERPTEMNLFVTGESEGIVRATLQNRIGSIASANGIDITSAASLPDGVLDGIGTIGLRFKMSGPFEGLHRIIGELETSRPLLFLRRVVLRRQGRSGGNRPMANGPLRLVAEIDVFAPARITPRSTSVREVE